MTNSACGETIYKTLNTSNYYLKHWPPFPASNSTTPFPTPNVKLRETWKSWTGTWCDESRTYLLEVDGGKPVFSLCGSCTLNMLPAAIPLTKEEEGQEVFVRQGFHMVVRLKTEYERKIIVLGSEISQKEFDVEA